MAELAILQHPDPTLRRSSAEVTTFDADLHRLVDDLFDTLAATRAIGLSAPQAGDLRQVVVVDVPDDAFGPRCYINPEILHSAAPGLVEEGCLSVPGVIGNVVRPTEVRVRALDRDGNLFERDVDGMHAVCLQHEMDHLVGKLFIDRLSWIQRFKAKAVMARQRRLQASA
jgi:peptide deformylase